MTEKEKKYIESAVNVFARYGVRRATMGDIATQAGVSRQTLYASYATKDDILSAAVRYHSEQKYQAIVSRWAELQEIGDKIDAFFQYAVIGHFDLVQQMPDSNDLLTGMGEASDAERQRAEDKKRQALAQLFTPFEEKLAAAGMNSVEMADFIHSSSVNYILVARDVEHLKRLLHSLKVSVLAILGEQ